MSLNESARDYANFLNLRKIEAGEWVIIKPEDLLEENKREGGGLEMFSRSTNEKKLR